MKGAFKIAKQSVSEFMKDNILNVAAAVAYYTIQSLFPLIIGLIVIASFFVKDGQARQDFINGVKSALPQLGGTLDIGKIIDQLTSSAPGLLSISGALLLWSGSGIFDQFVYGINVAYDVKEDKRNFFVKLGIRFGLLIVVGLLVAASFIVSLLFQILVSAKVSVFGISPSVLGFLVPVISYVLPLLLMFAVFAILYKVGPDRKDNKWRYVLIGAAVAAILFQLLKYGFSLYLTVFNAADSYTKSYGALGGAVLFLFYIWLSAAIMLFGAEVASVAGGWKSALQGPASQKDPGLENAAERVDSEAGAEVTPHEKATGQAKDRPATPAEGKEGITTTAGAGAGAGKTGSDSKGRDKIKAAGQQPTPAYAASTRRYPAQPDRQNPASVVIGAVVLAIAGLIGIIFKRKDPAA